MNLATVAAPPSLERQSGRGTIVLLLIAALIAVTFFVAAAVPYLTLNETRFGPYWPLRGWLLLHIGGGAVALLTGPIQLWLGLSDRRMALHRVLGVATSPVSRSAQLEPSILHRIRREAGCSVRVSPALESHGS